MPRTKNQVTLAELPDVLTAHRERHGLSRAQLANKCGFHYDTILKVENGVRLPSLETLCTIADVLDVEITDLLAEPS